MDNGAGNGTYNVMIAFIVTKEGDLLNFKPLTNHGYGMENEVIRILKISPKWIPAKLNGKAVNSLKAQNVTFVVGGF